MTNEDFFERYMKHLSAQQREAVTATDGPVLLLAVPGGGKTTVLVTRLGYMIKCCGIRPEEILTLTYTVAATRDMAARYLEIFGDGQPASGIPEFRTINGICAKIILYYGRLIGKPPFSLASDEKRLTAALGGIYRKVEGDYAGEAEINEVRRWITYVKNMMLTEDEIRQADSNVNFHLPELYTEYNRFLRSQHLMDYDDQLVYALTILKNSPETLRAFQKAYRYICVDEAQDTSRIQHEIIRLLAEDNENLFMVGDEDQSIYGFRAAYPEALLNFETDHPGAKVLLMEDNFRSNAGIVEAAGRFIGSNRLRHEKSMRPSRPAGVKIRIADLKGRGAQYTYLAKALADLKTQTAVLYRDNESLIPLADILERRGISYRVRSTDLTFFSSRTVTDIFNILLFAYHPADAELFQKIYYKVSSYLTKQQVEHLCSENAGSGRPLLSAALAGRSLSLHVRNQLKHLRHQFSEILTDSAGEAVRRITSEMGYRDYLERTGISDRKVRVLSILARRESDASSFLQRMAELEEILAKKEPDPACPLILSTIHSSKGLEYDSVYLIDVIDGIFPEKTPAAPLLSKWRRRGRYTDAELEDIRSWEEERRLFYVGVTRAKNSLTILRTSDSSKLVDDFRMCLEEEPVQKQSVPEHPASAGSGRIRDPFAARPPRKKNIQDDEGYLEFCRELGEGVMVEHAVFGEGVVVEMDDETVTVLFGNKKKRLGLPLVYRKALLWVV